MSIEDLNKEIDLKQKEVRIAHQNAEELRDEFEHANDNHLDLMNELRDLQKQRLEILNGDIDTDND